MDKVQLCTRIYADINLFIGCKRVKYIFLSPSFKNLAHLEISLDLYKGEIPQYNYIGSNRRIIILYLFPNLV